MTPEAAFEVAKVIPEATRGSQIDNKQAATAELRSAFNHLEQEGEGVCAWLSPRQQAAVETYRRAFGVEVKRPWDQSQLLDPTEEELQLIQQFRERIEQEGKVCDERDKAYFTDLILLKYLRARDLHLEPAHKLYLATLDWRREHKIWQWANELSRTDPDACDARVVGFDRLGRVVVYSSFAHSHKRTPDLVRLNTASMMEKTQQIQHAKTPGNIIWVNNFCARHKWGFGFSDCNPRFVWSGIHIFTDHYPECLHKMIIVDPPSIFFGLWRVVEPMLPAKTRQKGMFVDSRKDNHAAFVDIFGEELAGYLLQQIAKDSPR